MANSDRSVTDNVEPAAVASQAHGPALRPELDMASLLADSSPRAPRSVSEITSAEVPVLNGQGGLWWA